MEKGTLAVPMAPREAPGFYKPLAGQAFEHSTQKRDWMYGVEAGGQKEILHSFSVGVLSDGVILGKADTYLSIPHTTYTPVTREK